MAKRYYYYQAESNMRGPFVLDAATPWALPDGPGVYLLAGAVNGRFIVRYVGRGNSLRERVRHWVGCYEYLYYREAGTELGAFLAECAEYHRYGKSEYLDNQIHPAVPAGAGVQSCAELGCWGLS